MRPRRPRSQEKPLIRPNPNGKGNSQIADIRDGDVEAGFRQADQIIEFDHSLPLFSSHIPNPAGGVSWWYEDQLGSEGLNLWIEGAARERIQMANFYNLPIDKVTQNTMYQGGKYCDWGLRKVVMITPLLAKRTGRPVRAVNNRQNMYDVAITPRITHLKIGFKNDGLITAVQDLAVVDAGIRGSANFGATMDMTWYPFYTTRCVHSKSTVESVNTNTGRTR